MDVRGYTDSKRAHPDVRPAEAKADAHHSITPDGSTPTPYKKTPSYINDVSCFLVRRVSDIYCHVTEEIEQTNWRKKQIHEARYMKKKSSVALLPALIKRRKANHAMHTLTKKELLKFGTGLRSHKVEITEATTNDSRRWLMKIQLPDHGQSFEIVTALGHLREWRDLSTAIAFIQEVCPHTKAVSVVLKPPT